MTFRQRIAWWLHRLAYRFDNRDFMQRLSVRAPDGDVIVEWFIAADVYGHAVSAQCGPALDSPYLATWDDNWKDPA